MDGEPPYETFTMEISGGRGVWSSKAKVVKGLIVREPYASQILSGEKTEEIRSRPTKIRGRIAIIPPGSGMVAGAVDLVDSTGPHSGAYQYKDKTYRYILENPVKLKKPKPYKHPKGAVIWVNLD